MPNLSSRATRGAAVCAAGLLSVGGALGASPAVAAAPASLGTTVLSTAVVPGLAALQRLGDTPPTTTMQVGVSVAMDGAAIDATYAAINDPASPSYHHYLTPEEYTAHFAVPAATESAVTDAVTGRGLRVTYTSKDGSYVMLSGTAAQVEKTFSVTLGQFKGTDGHTYRANDQGATVPVGVQAVLGLTTFADAHLNQDLCLGGQCTGAMTPKDLWSIYDQPDSDRGRGQKVAIFGEGNLDTVVTDLRKFESENGLPVVPVRRVYVNDDKSDNSGLGEWDLDSQASTGMAPDVAELSFYFGQDLGDAAIAGIYSAWDDDPNAAQTGNSSFGGCESLNVALGGAAVDDQLFQRSNMEGRTMFVSTGDVGGSCGVGPAGVNGVSNGGVPEVEYPSSSQYVVAVGGTVLYSKAATATGSAQLQPPTRSLEYAWTYTGGGMSKAEPKPADQNGITPIVGFCAYTPSGGVPAPATPCRGIPDVASLSGDVATNGYAIVSAGADTETGGTSLSSPLWAGMWARVLASHPSTCANKYQTPTTTLGFAQPLLYGIGKDATAGTATGSTVSTQAFFDIGNTDGTSEPSGNGQQVPLPRSAADPSGWDYVSGLGTPDIANIMKDLNCGSTTPTVAVNPVPAMDDITSAPATGSCVSGLGTDGTMDEVSELGLGPAVQDDQVDLTRSLITSTPTSLTWVDTVVNLKTPTGAMASSDQGQEFQDEFSYQGHDYELDANIVAGDATDTYVITRHNPTATGGYTNTQIGTTTGAVNRAANTVTVFLPYSVFNTAAGLTPATGALGPGSALLGILVDSSNAASAADELSYGNCPYIIAGGPKATTPDPTVPEVPVTVLLPLTGVVLAGGVALRRRRRTV